MVVRKANLIGVLRLEQQIYLASGSLLRSSCSGLLYQTGTIPNVRNATALRYKSPTDARVWLLLCVGPCSTARVCDRVCTARYVLAWCARRACRLTAPAAPLLRLAEVLRLDCAAARGAALHHNKYTKNAAVARRQRNAAVAFVT
eukprot:6183445-Pleurochrysis_carterae.AAC.2